MEVDNNFASKVCPLCSSGDIRPHGDIEYRQPVMFSTHSVVLNKMPTLFICNACDSWFTQNILRENEAMALYRDGQSNMKWPRSERFEDGKPKDIIRRLREYFTGGKSVLDIGCNTGLLLDFAKKNGCRTFGVEPSKSSRLMIQGKGHYAYPAINDVEGRYQVITAFDLVEHLYDVPGFLNKARSLLTDDGVLILLTGDNGSISAKLSKNNWWYLKAPEHIVFPSRKYLLQLEGFRHISIDDVYVSNGYKRNWLIRVGQLIRKSMSGSYEGLPPLLPDHMLVVLGREGV